MPTLCGNGIYQHDRTPTVARDTREKYNRDN